MPHMLTGRPLDELGGRVAEHVVHQHDVELVASRIAGLEPAIRAPTMIASSSMVATSARLPRCGWG